MPPIELSFVSITRPHFEQILEEVQAETGVEATGDTGNVSGHGFDFSWQYDESESQLHIQCAKKPWMVPASVVQSKIVELVEGKRQS